MKKLLSLCLLGCVAFSNLPTYATQAPSTTQTTPAIAIDALHYTHPITLAEMMYGITHATQETLHPIMDTHYALPAMQKAEALGLIQLDEHPMETWLEPLTESEFQSYLQKANALEGIDHELLTQTFNRFMVTQLQVGEDLLDLSAETFPIYQGHLMVPVRPIAEAMGFKVTWNPSTYSAHLNNSRIESTVQAGYAAYVYSSVQAIGMSAPLNLTVAPRFIEGTLYVPVKYFSLFADLSEQVGTLTFNLR